MHARLEAIGHEIALELQSDVGQLAEEWLERMAPIPELAAFYPVEEQARAAVLENARQDIGRELAGLVDGRMLPRSCPAEVVASAQVAVVAGFPLWGCLQAYRTGHAVQWSAWSDAVESRDLDPPDRRALLRAGSDYMFAYADLCSRWMGIEYTRQRDQLLRSEEQRRVQAIRDILAGANIDSDSIGYPLDARHVGVIAWGREPEALVRAAADLLRAQLLTIAAEPETLWAWLALSTGAALNVRRVLRQLRIPAEVGLAIGEPATGLAGFRQTHREARDAQRVGVRRADPVTHYDDVALEALTAQDEDSARAFIARQLGELARDDERCNTLRQTLTAYFATAQQASSAAALLGVHERTIANRLRTIEQIVGRSVLSRRAELETALRLHRMLEAHNRSAAEPAELP